MAHEFPGMSTPTTETLDLRGLRCPLPLLRLKQALHQRTTGDEVMVLTTDSGALRDIPAFLRQAGHSLLSSATADSGEITFHIRKG